MKFKFDLKKKSKSEGETPVKTKEHKEPFVKSTMLKIDAISRKNDGKFPYVNWLDWRFKRVGYYELTYHPEDNEYHEDYCRIPKKDVPVEALHVSGKKFKVWYNDKTGLAHFPEYKRMTAIHVEQWRRNNLIDESFIQRWRSMKLDYKKIGMAVIIGVVALFVMYSMYGGQ